MGLKVKCLAFADDLALMAKTEEEAIRQIDELKETAEKAGLQISFEKSEIMPCMKNYPKQQIESKYGTLKAVSKFKYLVEISYIIAQTRQR